jgi:hypothetical protein
MRRALVMTLATVAVLMAALPAQAKVAGTGSISGPGIGGPGSGAADDGTISMRGTDGAGYPVMAGLFEAVEGSEQPPTEALGPRYTARFVTRQPPGVPAVVQHLYPFAEGGPLIYTAPGQEWIGGEDGTAPSGWFTMNRELLDELVVRGLPEAAPAPVQAPAVQAQPQPAPSGPSSLVWATLLLAGLLVLGAAAARRAIVRKAA